jgi:hypothetical protein
VILLPRLRQAVNVVHNVANLQNLKSIVMTKSIPLLLGAATFVLASCTKSDLSPNSSSSINQKLLSAATTQVSEDGLENGTLQSSESNERAIPFHMQTEETLQNYPLPSCSGELVYLTLSTITTINGVYIPSTNTIKTEVRTIIKGYDAYGEITGKKYIIREIGVNILSQNYSNNTLTIVFQDQAHIISPGSAGNFYVKQNIVATVDLLTNEVTFKRYDIVQECR